MPTHQMTKEDSGRIQSTQARAGGDMSSSGFAARAQSASDRWASAQSQGDTGSKDQGGTAGSFPQSGFTGSGTQAGGTGYGGDLEEEDD